MNNKFLLSVLVLFPAVFCHAGGVSLGATRVVFPEAATQSSLSIRNSSKNEAYLIQSWISDANGKKVNDFIITPPLFVIKPNKENTLRLEMVGKPAWPADREVLYYLNSKVIPSTSGAPEQTSSNSLQFATQTVIKMFMRPEGLDSSPAAAPASLTCHFSGNKVQISNPSPYYVSLVNLKAGTYQVRGTMIAPRSQSTLDFKGPVSTLNFQSINDYGSISSALPCKA